MALEKGYIQVDLTGGLDQRTDAKVVQPGRVTSITNGVFDKNGAVNKRKGMDSLGRTWFKSGLGGTGLITNTERVGEHNEEYYLIDGHHLYSYAASKAQFSQQDQVPEPVFTRLPVVNTPTSSEQPDVAYSNGLLLQTWMEGNEVYASLYDVTRGIYISPPQQLSAGGAEQQHSVISTNVPIVVWIDASLNVRTRRYVAGSWTSATTLGTTFNGAFDVCSVDGGNFLVAYDTTSTTMVVNHYTSVLALLDTYTNTDATGGWSDYETISIAVDTDDDRVYVAYIEDLPPSAINTKFFCFEYNTFTPVTTYTPIFVDSSYVPESVCIFRYEQDRIGALVGTRQLFGPTGSDFDPSFLVMFDESGVQLGSTKVTTRVKPVSRPFVYGDVAYAYVLYEPTAGPTASIDLIQSSIFCVDLCASADDDALEVFRPVGSIAVRSAAPLRTDVSSLPCNVVEVTPGVFWTLVKVRASASLKGRTALNFVKADFTYNNRWQGVSYGQNTLLSGGMPSVYDGFQVSEIGFTHYPEQVALTNHSTGGDIEDGQYQYVAVFEWVDGGGQVHQSAPSIAATTTISGGLDTNSITVTFKNLSLTTKQEFLNGYRPLISIALYRTTANGTIFYRVTPENVTTQALLNDPSSVTVLTYLDTVSDTDLAVNQILYTTGGVVPNVIPPSFSSLCVYRERVFGVGDDPTVLWFSKRFVPGEGVAFSDLFTISFAEGGAITALCVLDGQLIVFKENRIYVLVGDGPSDTNVGSDYAIPLAVSTDVGCVNPLSVVSTPMGVLFQSAKGIYLLSRSLDVALAGGEVEDTLAAYPYITSAVLLENYQHVRFTCTNEARTAGCVLFLDYLQKAWGTFRYYDLLTANTSVAPASACVSKGVYTYATPGGASYTESSYSYFDAGRWVTLDVELAWVKTAGLHGFQRVQRVALLGTQYGACDLTLQVGINFSDSYAETHTWKAANTVSLPNPELVAHVANQKCQALRVRITDATPTAGDLVQGEGFRLNGIGLIVGVKPGLSKVPAPQRG